MLARPAAFSWRLTSVCSCRRGPPMCTLLRGSAAAPQLKPDTLGAVPKHGELRARPVEWMRALAEHYGVARTLTHAGLGTERRRAGSACIMFWPASAAPLRLGEARRRMKNVRWPAPNTVL